MTDRDHLLADHHARLVSEGSSTGLRPLSRDDANRVESLLERAYKSGTNEYARQKMEIR